MYSVDPPSGVQARPVTTPTGVRSYSLSVGIGGGPRYSARSFLWIVRGWNSPGVAAAGCDEVETEAAEEEEEEEAEEAAEEPEVDACAAPAAAAASEEEDDDEASSGRVRSTCDGASGKDARSVDRRATPARPAH